jgi:hypothetical protein
MPLRLMKPATTLNRAMSNAMACITSCFLYICFATAIIFSSCQKDETPVRKIKSSPVVTLLSTKVLAYAPKTLDIEFKFILSGGFPLQFYDLISSSVLYFNGSWGNYATTGDSLWVSTESNIWSNAILVEQSGTFDSVDPQNYRAQAFNAYYGQILPDQRIALAATSKDGPAGQDVLEIKQGFTSGYSEELLQDFVWLADNTGGKSCVYDALYELLEYTSANAPGNHRSITVFLHSPDEVSTKTAHQVIQLAISENIRVNTIWLEEDALDARLLTEIPARTGGFSIYCPDLDHITTAFLSMDAALSGNYHANTLRVRFTKSTPGNFHPGYEMLHCFSPWGNHLLPNLWFFIKI